MSQTLPAGCVTQESENKHVAAHLNVLDGRGSVLDLLALVGHLGCHLLPLCSLLGRRLALFIAVTLWAGPEAANPDPAPCNEWAAETAACECIQAVPRGRKRASRRKS